MINPLKPSKSRRPAGAVSGKVGVMSPKGGRITWQQVDVVGRLVRSGELVLVDGDAEGRRLYDEWAVSNPDGQRPKKLPQLEALEVAISARKAAQKRVADAETALQNSGRQSATLEAEVRRQSLLPEHARSLPASEASLDDATMQLENAKAQLAELAEAESAARVEFDAASAKEIQERAVPKVLTGTEMLYKHLARLGEVALEVIEDVEAARTAMAETSADLSTLMDLRHHHLPTDREGRRVVGEQRQALKSYLRSVEKRLTAEEQFGYLVWAVWHWGGFGMRRPFEDSSALSRPPISPEAWFKLKEKRRPITPEVPWHL